VKTEEFQMLFNNKADRTSFFNPHYDRAIDKEVLEL